jgi:thioredoxin-like negative regulator of GroEL
MSHQSLKALLLTAPGCVHCAALKKILEKIVAEGLIEKLEVVDITSNPEIANKYNVKSVPWLKLGLFEFQGAQRESELRYWLTQLDTQQGITRYLKHLLETGELGKTINLIIDKPDLMGNLITLVQDEENDMKVRLGVSAVFEEFEGSPLLQESVALLGELISHKNPKIRADVAHYLSLAHTDAAVIFLRKLAQDPDREVSEIANDGLSDLDY